MSADLKIPIPPGFNGIGLQVRLTRWGAGEVAGTVVGANGDQIDVASGNYRGEWVAAPVVAADLDASDRRTRNALVEWLAARHGVTDTFSTPVFHGRWTMWCLEAEDDTIAVFDPAKISGLRPPPRGLDQLATREVRTLALLAVVRHFVEALSGCAS